MTDLHPNVTTYLHAIDAFNRDDLTAVRDHVRADVVYRIPGRGRVAVSSVASKASPRSCGGCGTSRAGPSRSSP